MSGGDEALVTSQPEREIALLLIEDSPLDAELILARLEADGLVCRARRVDDLEALSAALSEGGVDLVLSDFSLPRFDGFTALESAKARLPDVPFVFVSGAIGEEKALETVRRGATDYVLKDRLERLSPAVRRALREADDRRERRRATERAERLQALAAALVGALSPEEVARVAVSHGVAAVRADGGACWLVSGDEASLELCHERGFPSSMPRSFGAVPLGADVPVAVALRDNLPIWLATREEYEERFPRAAALTEPAPGAACACIPLVIDGRSLGTLVVLFRRSNAFDADDRAFLVTLGRQVAQALDRARLHAAERASAERLLLIARASEVLGSSLDYETTLNNIIGLMLPALGDFGFFDIEEPDGSVRRLARAHRDDALERALAATRWSRSMHTEMNLCALSTGDVALHPRIDDAWLVKAASSPEHLAAMRSLGFTSMLSVPLSADGHTFGALTLFHGRSGRHHGEADTALAGELARRAAAAVTNARLYLDARDAERRAHEAARRVHLLAEASRVFASARLDLRATLDAVVRFLAESTGDGCVLMLGSADRSRLELGACAHSDPHLDALQRAALARPFTPYDTGAGQVFLTGEPLLSTDLDPARLPVHARPEARPYFEKARLGSVVIVPLVVGESTLGTLGLARSVDDGRAHDRDDLATLRDVAERASLAIEAARLFREANEASRLKDEFLATVSHELRTPMNAVLGWSTMLRARSDDPQAVARGLEVIERNARSQARLIEDVLDVSRIITGKLRLDMRPVEVAQVVRAALESVGPSAHAKRITLETRLDPSAGTVVADAERLQQIVWNLASNAVKFTPAGGRVTASAWGDGDQVFVRVVDTGAGIRHDFLPHVFERFRQADSSTTRVQGGLGLGLAIARHLAELHGGTIAAESEGEGRGSSFTVSLPVRPPASSRKPEPHEAPKAHPPPRAPSRPLEGVLVLVCDDEPDARGLLVELLESQGARIAAASTVVEALSLFERERPDVVVSDIAMPGEDGYSFIRRIRSLPPDKGGAVPAVALTAYARSEDARRAFAAGFQLHVPKPVEPEQLVAVVASLGGRPAGT